MIRTYQKSFTDCRTVRHTRVSSNGSLLRVAMILIHRLDLSILHLRPRTMRWPAYHRTSIGHLSLQSQLFSTTSFSSTLPGYIQCIPSLAKVTSSKVFDTIPGCSARQSSLMQCVPWHVI